MWGVRDAYGCVTAGMAHREPGRSRTLLRKEKVVERGFLGCPGQDTELSFLRRSLCCYARERGNLVWLCWENAASWHDFDTSLPKPWERGSEQVV